MLRLIGVACATGSILFDLASYYKQIKKTLRAKHSGQVSSSSYLMKLSHYICSLIALFVFCNWTGFTMEASALCACLLCFIIVIKRKPKGWRLFSFGK